MGISNFGLKIGPEVELWLLWPFLCICAVENWPK